MTERDPDPLYDALRDRLADYGQEPPAQLWAGIRAQLPPPVAQPQLRRRRRWSPALLLCLLLTVAGAAGWQWWRTAGQGPAASTSPQVATGKKAAASDELGSSTPSTRPAVAASRENSTDQAAVAASKAAPVAASAEALAPSLVAALPADGKTRAAGAISASSGRQQQQMTRERPTRLARGNDAQPFPTAKARNTAVAFQGRAATPAATVTAIGTGAEAGAASLGSAAIAVGPATANPPGVAVSQAPGATEPNGFTPLPPPAVPGPAAPAMPGAAVVAATGTADNAAVSMDPMALRVATIASLPSPEPVVRARPDTARAVPAAVVRRWAALVLAGPAVTYRKLGGGNNLDYAPLPPPNTAYPYAFANRTANQVAQEEKPAVGFGLQVQVRRALSGRWGLSTGLGYQHYAIEATTTIQSNNDAKSIPGVGSSAPPPVISPVTTEAEHHDTYRFLTVPVRLSYALGYPAGRFRYGLLAGVDAALYLGGSSPAANGQTNTWDATGSPYRSLNAAFIAGLDLRYRLAPRWDLVAQPTATYLLNSLPRPASGLTPRHLLGAGAQVGVSYDFR